MPSLGDVLFTAGMVALAAGYVWSALPRRHRWQRPSRRVVR